MPDAVLESFDMSAAELTTEIERHGAWVAECLADPHEAWHPHLFAFVKSDPSEPTAIQVLSLMVPFSEARDKHAVLREVGARFYRERVVPVAVILSTEAWLSSRCDVEPRHDPDRREVIVVQGKTMLRNLCGIARMPIARNAAGQIVPGAFEPVAIEGVRSPLLDQVFAGFAAAAGYKAPRS